MWSGVGLNSRSPYRQRRSPSPELSTSKSISHTTLSARYLSAAAEWAGGLMIPDATRPSAAVEGNGVVASSSSRESASTASHDYLAA